MKNPPRRHGDTEENECRAWTTYVLVQCLARLPVVLKSQITALRLFSILGCFCVWFVFYPKKFSPCLRVSVVDFEW
jgi:hypothetical protein